MFCLQISHSEFPVGRRTYAQVSLARDIRPLFRAVDISHMKSYGIKLDDCTFMSGPDNANKVLGTLSPHEGDPPSMPPGRPRNFRGRFRWGAREAICRKTLEERLKHYQQSAVAAPEIRRAYAY